jgi:hypothetical protein
MRHIPRLSRMHYSPTLATVLLIALSTSLPSQGRARILVEQRAEAAAETPFQFTNLANPSATDAATNATFTLLSGSRDGNGADLAALHDGKLPTGPDAPRDNFFFAGRSGGRLLVDLGKPIELAAVNTYSWHAGPRGPQCYTLFAADGSAAGFDAAPKGNADLAQSGWTTLAVVDSRSKLLGPEGQHGVSVCSATGSLGTFRYLLFEVQATDRDDANSQTFFSEIDAVAIATPVAPIVARSADGKCEITLDVSAAPALQAWATQALLPVMQEWYPKIVALLPGEGFTAPTSLRITFESPGRGVAATRGTDITCATDWFLDNLDGEAKGAVVHELVHVVQQYGQRPRDRGMPAPGWLTEGIADYIRWYLYEPESHGADRINPSSANITAGYRVTANFLNWLSATHADAVPVLNSALRTGAYSTSFCTEHFGKRLPELGKQWQKELLAKDEAVNGGPNTLTIDERRAGWQLLWNGKDWQGWHSYHHKDVLPGWQIKDGVITCADPHNAGDLCTNEQYDAFELSLEYNISRGGNSGIMFHVNNQGGATWASGPECQLLDNKEGKDPQRAGWLYGLYSTQVDATRPAGEWNQLRILISPEGCAHQMNGVTYFQYMLNSPDFNQRLAKSKFASMPKFAKSGTGFLALQGDHGLISFRNLKIRPIVPKQDKK